MGAEESKSTSYGLMRASSVVSNMNKQAQRARPWSLLHQCSPEQWKTGHAEAAGFSETTLMCNGILYKDCSRTFCTSRQGIVNINKSTSIFSFRRKSKFTKMAQHFEYNHIPAHLSSIQNFHVKSVLCYNNNIVILHLVRNLMSQFGVIDLGINKFLGLFGHQTVEFVNEALRGQISPDLKYCMLKLPSLKANSNAFVFQLYCIKSAKLITETSVPYDQSLFAFDPRFHSSRLAATSFIKNEENSLCVMKTDGWEVLDSNLQVDDSPVFAAQNPKWQDIFYSRDGSLIFVIMDRSGCTCRERKSRPSHPIDISMYIFNSDTTQTLHCIQYHRYACGKHSCPINYMPIFSNCGNRMAIMLNDLETTIDHIQIYKLPSSGNLQNRCRTRILQHFPPEVIPKLPLPSKIISYLGFQPEYA